MNPLVTIVIPCFNHGALIGETLASLKAQTRTDFETIIVDDASTDPRTRETLARLADEGWKVLYQETNGGPGKARNRAIAEARGTYIVPLDADDLLTPEYLEKVLAVITGPEGKAIRVVYTGARYFGSRDDLAEWPPYAFPEMLIRPMVPATCLFRKADWAAIGGYAENMREAWEDYDFAIGLAGLGGRFHKIDEPLFLYRQTADASSRNHWVNSTERASRLFRTMMKNRREVYAANWAGLMPLLIDEHLRLEVLERVLPQSFQWTLRQEPDVALTARGNWSPGRWQRIFLPGPTNESGPFAFQPFNHPGAFQIHALEVWRAGRRTQVWRGEELSSLLTTGGSLIERGICQWQSFGADPSLILTSGAVLSGDRMALWIRGTAEPVHLEEAARLTAEAVHERDLFRQEKKERVLEKAYLEEVARRRRRQAGGFWPRRGWSCAWLRKRWVRKQAAAATPGWTPEASAAGRIENLPDGRVRLHTPEPWYALLLLTPEKVLPLLPDSPYWQEFTLSLPLPAPAVLVGMTNRKDWLVLYRNPAISA